MGKLKHDVHQPTMVTSTPISIQSLLTDICICSLSTDSDTPCLHFSRREQFLTIWLDVRAQSKDSFCLDPMKIEQIIIRRTINYLSTTSSPQVVFFPKKQSLPPLLGREGGTNIPAISPLPPGRPRIMLPSMLLWTAGCAPALAKMVMTPRPRHHEADPQRVVLKERSSDVSEEAQLSEATSEIDRQLSEVTAEVVTETQQRDTGLMGGSAHTGHQEQEKASQGRKEPGSLAWSWLAESSPAREKSTDEVDTPFTPQKPHEDVSTDVPPRWSSSDEDHRPPGETTDHDVAGAPRDRTTRIDSTSAKKKEHSLSAGATRRAHDHVSRSMMSSPQESDDKRLQVSDNIRPHAAESPEERAAADESNPDESRPVPWWWGVLPGRFASTTFSAGTDKHSSSNSQFRRNLSETIVCGFIVLVLSVVTGLLCFLQSVLAARTRTGRRTINNSSTGVDVSGGIVDQQPAEATRGGSEVGFIVIEELFENQLMV